MRYIEFSGVLTAALLCFGGVAWLLWRKRG